MNAKITLSPEQGACVGEVVEFLGNRKTSHKPFFVVGGLAGTGKTTILKEVSARARDLKLKVAVVAPTGKAAQVLNKKGVSATSVHRLVYEMVSLVPLTFKRTDKVDADVIIVDESSMVNSEMLKDILSFRKPVVFVGDYGQLPPIGGDPGIMTTPDFTLKRIFRQAEGNEIIQLANQVRNFPEVPVRQALMAMPRKDVVLAPSGAMRNVEYLQSFDQIIVGKNITRKMINNMLRKNKARPTVGDKVICLKNNYQFGVVNGEQFLIAEIFAPCEENEYVSTIKLLTDEGEHITVPYWSDYFFDDNLGIRDLPRDTVWLDFAYAITCHKAQGSEWESVMVVNEAFGDEKSRWLYTAITRASKKLTWL